MIDYDCSNRELMDQCKMSCTITMVKYKSPQLYVTDANRNDQVEVASKVVRTKQNTTTESHIRAYIRFW